MDKEIILALIAAADAAAAARRAKRVQRVVRTQSQLSGYLAKQEMNPLPPRLPSPACINAAVELRWLRTPVILEEGRVVSDGGQVDIGPGDVGQLRQLADDVVDHQPHEAQSLEVVGPGGEDLVQPLQVLPQAALHVPQRAGDLSGDKRNGCHTHKKRK